MISQETEKRVNSESFEALVEDDFVYPYLKFYEEVHKIIYADPKLVEKTIEFYKACGV